MAVALDLHVLAHGHGARPARPGPRSFRPRSTSMTCSARSFGSRWSCSARSWSSRASAPRGRVPAIGWVVRRSPSTWRRSSGRRADDLERRRPDEEQVRARVDPAQRPVERDAVERPRRSRGRSAGRTTGVGRGRPGSPRPPRSRPWRPRRRGCRRRGRGSCRWRPRGAGRAAPPPSRRARRACPPSSAALGRAVRSSASKIACLGDPVAALEVRRARCGATRSPRACGSGGRRRGRGRSR